MREEEKKRTSQNTKLNQFFRKRWVFPAIYLMSAAVILTAVLWYQGISNDVAEDLNQQNNQGEDVALEQPEAVEVNALKENFAMPAVDPDQVQVVKKFYDANASTEEQEAALVFYNNTYRMNKGIDIAREDQKDFDVVASLSGTVSKAEKDPILGYVVEIEHENDVVTVYQSLAEASVQAGDKVEQNELIGKAGKNLYNEEDGIHLHFEVRQSGKAVNPLTYMDKPVTSIEEATTEQATEEAKEEEAPAEEAPAEDSETPKEEGVEESDEKSPETDKDAQKGETEGSEDSTQPEASTNTTNS
ncbi:stage II sporulation protein Q [Metabacillus crassostreae]|uniref:M23 family metallopeptidase n=1 Tax=Metabacillus crassostreae TaxID=929098 RepID=UPI00195A37BC|nr:M23 family metallopeptidase [Metabacillus crassostreae]MBM7605344.1 stage II sporulation protein Q [Metabacillus crassostreae]